MIKGKNITKLKVGLASLLTGATILANTWFMTGNKPDNLSNEEYSGLTSNLSTNQVSDSGSITNHSRYWGTQANSDSYINIFDESNLVASVQADDSGNWFTDLYGTNGTTYNAVCIDGSNTINMGFFNHIPGGTPQVTNNLREVIANTEALEIKSFSNDSSNVYLSWNTYSGVTYNVTSSTNLLQGFNQTNHTYSATNTQEYTYSEPITDKQHFYRLEALIQ